MTTDGLDILAEKSILKTASRRETSPVIFITHNARNKRRGARAPGDRREQFNCSVRSDHQAVPDQSMGHSFLPLGRSARAQL